MNQMNGTRYRMGRNVVKKDINRIRKEGGGIKVNVDH
jgi:biotin operon repressor